MISINIMKPAVITTSAMILAAQHQIPFLMYNNTGDVEARVWSASYQSIVSLRKNQVYFTDAEEGWRYMRSYMCGKFEFQMQLLSFLSNRISIAKIDLLKAVESIKGMMMNKPIDGITKEQFRGLEGSIAKVYWTALSKALIKYVNFDGRDKRNPDDVFNSCINYGYGILYGVVESSLLMVGLDPYMGILHVDRHDRCTLGYDHIEIFRHWVDRMVIELFMQGQLVDIDFENTDEGLRIAKSGRIKLIQSFFTIMEERSLLGRKKIKKLDHIHYQSQQLANIIRDFRK